MKLVQLPGTDLYVNPAHVVYVEQMPPYERNAHAGQQRVEVCITMYGRYRTKDVFDKTAEEVAKLINKGE
jgi:hypothetical protein